MKSEVFDKAIQIIETQGWCQGVSTDPNGSVCAARAIGLAVKTGVENGRDLAKLYAVMAAKEAGVQHLYRWNDAPGRVRDEVIALFRTCGDKLRESET